ncbi:MAG: LPXTG cell wall anchor domain-containing protein [Tissierellia bacterium]|nr:LPXTG cell wall anchor domain-containing protein [Tissierellia bacterium]
MVRKHTPLKNNNRESKKANVERANNSNSTNPKTGVGSIFAAEAGLLASFAGLFTSKRRKK